MNYTNRNRQEEINKRRRLEQLSRARMDMFELCCHSESELVKQLELAGGSAMRMTLEAGYDWTKASTYDKAVRDFNKYRPRMVWGSPTCGPYSSVQNMNNRSEQQVRDLEATFYSQAHD